MAMFETREEVLERVMAQDKPLCPHCGKEMSIWESPPFAVGDGLGWDSPYLFVCFNDECPCYVEGWKNLMDNYAQQASYRCIQSPNSTNFDLMPVFSSMGGSGQIVDEQILAEENALKESIKKGFSVLAECYVSKDAVSVMRVLMDATEPARVRIKAAEMAGDLADIEAVELLTNHRFGNEKLQASVNDAVKNIHERFFTRECPFCAEIIKKRSKICKHCNKDVSGV